MALHTLSGIFIFLSANASLSIVDKSISLQTIHMTNGFTKEEEKVLLRKSVRSLMSNPLLNAWEKDFLASIDAQLLSKEQHADAMRRHTHYLSEKQLNVLNKIKRKYSHV